MSRVSNSQGKIWYGMHFCAGVAEYRPAGKEPFRVFLNENTIREMDKTFAGRPVYVEHVDGVPAKVDDMRKEADGFVVESFFNAADGKHWVKFITCSEDAEEAINRGWKLSNCYEMQSSSSGGEWNGVPYDRQIMSAEYEHLAIVSDPRYAESIILTPEQFKTYNEKKTLEISRLANNKGASMFKFFKRTQIENSKDYEGSVVQLPKSKREATVEVLLNELDELELSKGKPRLANESDEVELEVEGEKKKVTVMELLKMLSELEGKVAAMENEKGGEAEDDEEKKKKKLMENEAHEAEMMKKKEDEEKAKNAADAKAKADKLKNANEKSMNALPVRELDLSGGTALGKSRYGSK